MSGTERFIGTSVGNYRVIAEIGSGGFGKVYRGEHTILKERAVAVKLLHAHLSASEDCERFLQEAHLLEHLKHANILHIFDVGIYDGFPYLVAEYAPQGSLRDLIKRYAPNPLPTTMAVNILTQVGQALYYAHQLNIVHRDLKPENILFNAEGNALLADFGIATTLSTSSIKQVNITGTPSYMAPEQFQGSVSKESDQYALGCIAYELFTGQVPFEAPDFFAMGFNHLSKWPTAPTQLNPGLPRSIEQAILKAMAKQRHDRYVDIKAFIMGLHASYNAQPQAYASAPATLLPDRGTYFIPTPDKQLTAPTSSYTTPVAPLPAVHSTPVTPLPPINVEPMTPLPPVYGEPVTPAPPVYGEPMAPSQFTMTQAPLPNGTPLQLADDADTYVAPIHTNKVSPVKHKNKKQRWILIAVACLVVFASLLATLPRVFADHTSQLQAQGTVQNTTTTQPLTTNTLGTTATVGSSHVPAQTSQNQPTQAATPIASTTTVSATNPITPTTAAATATFTPTPTHTPTPLSETLDIYFINGTKGVSTTHSYSGKVTIHVTGAGEEYTNKWLDAFYQYTDSNGNQITPVHTSTYPGWTLWINGGVADDYVNPIPSYTSSHDYTFTYTAPAGVQTFAIGDTYAKDNSGNLTLTITQG